MRHEDRFKGTYFPFFLGVVFALFAFYLGGGRHSPGPGSLTASFSILSLNVGLQYVRKAVKTPSQFTTAYVSRIIRAFMIAVGLEIVGAFVGLIGERLGLSLPYGLPISFFIIGYGLGILVRIYQELSPKK